MSDDKPIGVRVQRPYATREEFLDAEYELLGRSSVTLLGAKPRAPGTLLRFEVVLTSGEPIIRAEGRVVGPREVGSETGLQVKLTRIDNRTKAILDEAATRKTAKSIPPRNPSQVDTSPPPPGAQHEVPPAAESQAAPLAESSQPSLPDEAPESQLEPAPLSMIAREPEPVREQPPERETARADAITGPHDRAALLARLRSRMRS